MSWGFWIVHGSLARAGKVKSQCPKVDKQEKKKTPKGRAKKRTIYNRRWVLCRFCSRHISAVLNVFLIDSWMSQLSLAVNGECECRVSFSYLALAFNPIIYLLLPVIGALQLLSDAFLPPSHMMIYTQRNSSHWIIVLKQIHKSLSPLADLPSPTSFLPIFCLTTY